MKSKILGLLAVGLLAGPMTANAVATTYSFSESMVGSGTFAIDVGPTLGTYYATAVSGGPGSNLGTWTLVLFRAEVGFLPELQFGDGTKGVGYPTLAIGGGNVLQGSTADAEWANFLQQYSSIITAESVPEPGTLALLGLGLAGLGLSRRRKA